MTDIGKRAWEKYPEVIKHHNLAIIDINEEKRKMYIEIATEQEVIDEEFHTSEVLRIEKEHKEEIRENIRRSNAVLAAKILDSLGAGLPSFYYEEMEKKTLDEIAEIVVKRITLKQPLNWAEVEEMRT